MKLELRPKQIAAREAIAQAFRDGHKRVMVCAPCGFGKCHGRGTKVVAADGSVIAVEDVRVGDRLLSPTGSYRTVLSLGRGRERMYRVVPVKGDPYTVNESHLLSLKLSGPDRVKLADGRMVSPGEVVAVDVPTYLASGKTARTVLKGWRSGVVEFDTDKHFLAVPPYILGAWLGDGRATGAQITKPDCKMVEEWCAWGERMGCEVRRDTSNGTRCQTVRLVTPRGQNNLALELLWVIDVRGNKHIPMKYLTASEADRLELLAGLLDSDGHVIGSCYDWISKDEHMARAFAFLARSLGFACYVSAQRKGIKSIGFSAIYWRCSLSGDTDRIPCRDKKAQPRTINKSHLVTGIQAIEPLGEDDYFGFELDGDHLYLLEDFTVCHNTELATAVLMATFENGKRGAFIADRISLVTQTSERFDKYALPHGIMQAQHWRFRPSEQIQVCSIQTLQKRQWPDGHLMVVDEAHILSEGMRKKLEAKDRYAIGLSATPITKGLGKYFDVVINAATTNDLIDIGLLVPIEIHSFKQPDMQGVGVKSDGEYKEGETEKRVMQVVGDVVQTYIEKGGNRKFIGFAATIAHAQELQRQFIAAGINVATYTADDQPEDRHEIVQEFKKPNSTIRGILSVEALTRGFDVTDVEVLIDARPLRKALHVYVQMLGRVMRTHEGKTHATVFDHSGNAVHFYNGWNELFENGVSELDDGKPKPKKEAVDKPVEPMTCPTCSLIHKPQPMCPRCGHQYPRRIPVENVPGTLSELIAGRGKYRKELTQQIWPQLCGYALEKYTGEVAERKAKGWFKGITGDWPRAEFSDTKPVPCTHEVRNRILSVQIAFAHSKKKAQGVPA